MADIVGVERCWCYNGAVEAKTGEVEDASCSLGRNTRGSLR